jgi:hypothetical protein
MDRSHLLTTQPEKFGGTTWATAVLDRSGSMIGLVDDVIGGFNTWVESLAQGDPGARVSLVIFDNEYTVVYENLPVTNPDTGKFNRDLLIDSSVYSARGSTDLYNSANKALMLTDRYVKEGDRALFCLATDGEHNVPGEINSPEQFGRLVKDREARGNWTFTFLNASPDQFAGRLLGFHDANTLIINAAMPDSTLRAYNRLSRGTFAYAAQSTPTAGAAFYAGQENEDDEGVTTLASVVTDSTETMNNP